MSTLYTSGQYLANTGSWHAEDSHWKAQYIADMLLRNAIPHQSLLEVGCGAGGILDALSAMPGFDATRFHGYDISPKAIELCEARRNPKLGFTCGDVFADRATDGADVLAVIDVFEHVPDYMGFLGKCRSKARYKIYHVPLEIHLSAVMRGKVDSGRYSVGHLHYFTAESAMATLKDTGHVIVDQRFTDLALLTASGRGAGRLAANLARRMVSSVSQNLAARWLGGISMLVLTR